MQRIYCRVISIDRHQVRRTEDRCAYSLDHIHVQQLIPSCTLDVACTDTLTSHPPLGVRNPLTVRNRRIYLVWLIALSIFLWGAFAVYLATPAIIGLACSCAAVVAMLAFNVHIRWTALTQLASAMATIDFGESYALMSHVSCLMSHVACRMSHVA